MMRKENCELPWNGTKNYAVKVVRVAEAGAKFNVCNPTRAVTYWRADHREDPLV